MYTSKTFLNSYALKLSFEQLMIYITLTEYWFTQLNHPEKIPERRPISINTQN